MYVDGILRDEASGTWVAPGDYFYLAGGNAGNDFGDGVWDEVRIYERALTPLEIQLMASMSDYDDDRDVDTADLAALLNEWMTDNPGCEAASVFDNNVDCKVNLGDFANFARSWLLGM